MSKFWKAPAIAALALGTLLISAPPASAAVRVGFRGGFYGRGWYGGGWGPAWYGPAWYGPGWYGPYWGGYSYGPPAGKVKIVSPDKQATVFVDGGYAGPVEKMKKFSLRPGAHDIEVRDQGRVLFKERVEVLRGKTIEVHANPAG